MTILSKFKMRYLGGKPKGELDSDKYGFIYMEMIPKSVLLLTVLFVAVISCNHDESKYTGISSGSVIKSDPSFSEKTSNNFTSDAHFKDLFDNSINGEYVKVKTIIHEILSDDNCGMAHQRFIIRLHSGQTILVAHNIDIAPQVVGLQKADTIIVYGEYVWNNKGGLIHWTHHDPNRKNTGGWLEYKGNRYQ